MRKSILLGALAALVFGWLTAVPAQAAGETNLVAVARSTSISAPLEGDVQAIGGALTIASVVSGDVVTIGTRVRFEGAGEVRGSFIAAGGSVAGLTRERVAGEIWAPGTIRGAAGDAPSGQVLVDMMSEPFSLAAAALKVTLTLFWILAAAIVILVADREVRASSIEIRAALLHAFLLGLVAFTSFVLTAILFAWLTPWGIGYILLAILGAFAFITKVYGMVAVFHLVGSMLMGPRTHEEAATKWLRGDLALVVLGGLVLGALRLVPVVGNVVWISASLVGIGVALATGFGRREPWFLAWRESLADEP